MSHDQPAHSQTTDFEWEGAANAALERRAHEMERESQPERAKTTIYWRKEFPGTHRAYRVDKEIAVVQGSKVQGWRYSLKPGDWSIYLGTAAAAKRAVEKTYDV